MLRILHASSRVKPWEANVWAAPGLFFACAFAYCEDAEACLYASAKARPRTRDPVMTTCVIIRCACNLKGQSKRPSQGMKQWTKQTHWSVRNVEDGTYHDRV